MTPYQIAAGLVGLREAAGPQDNPAIMEMYSVVGHDWVEHDETAWCAAFVGYCLEKAGVRSTRKLNAKSYLDWGISVPAADVQQGDIAVIPRGGKNSWQGHVFFVDRIDGATVYGLGGNQSDAVNIKPFRLADVLDFRRAAGVGTNPMPSVVVVQRRLKELGYHEVGAIDGIAGSRTRGAILAFRADNGLRLTPDIDRELAEALLTAAPRQIDPKRAAGEPTNSRIIEASKKQVVLGAAGGAAVVIPALEQTERSSAIAKRILEAVGVSPQFEALLPWFALAIFIGIVMLAIRTQRARVEDHQTGRTP